MEIGEQDSTFVQQDDFVRLGLFHLDGELGPVEYLARPIRDLRARRFVIHVAETDGAGGVAFDDHPMTPRRDLAHAGGSQPDPALVRLGFFRNADQHVDPFGSAPTGPLRFLSAPLVCALDSRKDDMRAVVARELGPPEKLIVESLPSLSPGPGEIVVRTQAAAVNFPDLLAMEGKYQVRPPLPFTPGKEAAGLVGETGEGVVDFAPGDRVVVQVEWGAFAEEIVAPASQSYPVPVGVGFEEAAAIGIAGQTAHFALVDRAAAAEGDRVLVTGASGSVGLAALQVAKALGCETIAGLATMSKEDLVRANGADHVIDLSADNPRDSIREQVRDVVRGGVDIVVEMIGGEVFDGAIRTLQFGGRLVVVGFAGGVIPSLRANYLLLKNIAVTGVNWASYRDRDPVRVRRVQAELFDMLEAGKLHVPVQASYPIEDVAKACAVLSERRVRGKVVLTF